MNKFPKWGYFLAFLLLGCLSMTIMLIFGIIYFKEQFVKLTQTEFYMLYGINTIVSMLAAGCFVKTLHAWTPVELAERMNNMIEINYTIIALHRRKMELKSEIPDWVRVIFTDYEVKRGK